MNRVYRLVFNRVLGILQVASELVRAAAGSGRAVDGRRVATLRPVSFALWAALGWVGIAMPAAAQQTPPARTTAGEMGRIVADPSAPWNQRPTVVAAPNGTPMVNITTPSAAGVSHNTYSQFDVGAKGAILNNSRTNAQTQLGGWVQGNPWLATGTARVILNEVNSANPSYLNGYVEVAGDRAEVIIANPAGIQVDGGGFLNASRATLTTGKPVFNGGSLDAYRVEGGVIGVSGAGLDASQTDYTGLIARSLQINAGIWAQNLVVTAGSNEVAAVAGTTQLRRPASAAPGFAIDVGQLGGMYAGKITLVGTEHGVGVRNAGAIGAQAGDLVVTVDGRLENTGSLQSQQDTRVVASGGIANAGILSAGRELTVDTSQDLDNSGGTLNAMRVAVDAQSLRNRDGAIEQTGLQALALNSGALSNRDGGRIGEIDAGAGGNPGTSEPAEGGTPGTGNDAGSGSQDGGGSGPGSDDTGDGAGPSVPPVVPLADGALHITGLLDNDGGRISAGGGIDLSTATGLDNAGGQLGVRSLTVAQGDLLNQGGALTVTGAARLDVASFDNDAGTFQANEALSLRAGSLSNREGRIQHGGTEDTRIDIAGTLDNTDGTLATNAGALEIAAGHLVNRGGLIQHAGADGLTLATGRLDGDQGTIATAGALQLAAAGISHREATLSAQQVAIDAASLDNHGGQIVATGSDANRLRVDGELDNSDGSLASNGDLSLEAGRFVNVDGVVQQAGDGVLSIDAAILEGRGGTLASNGSLSIAGETTDLAEGITSAQRIAIATGDLTTAGGQLTATGTDLLRLQVRGTLDNSTGILGTNGALALDAGMLDNRQGRLVAAGTAPSIAQVSGAFDNRDGEFSTGGDTVLRAGALNNAGGILLAAEQATLQVTVDGRLDNSARGQIAAGGELTLVAATLDNRGGAIEHAGEGMLSVQAGTLQGEGGSIRSGGTLALAGGDIDLRNGVTQADRIDVAADTLTTAGGALVSTGEQALRLQVLGALDNAGGAITANGALDVAAGSLDNREGTLTSAGTDATTIDVAGTLDNTDGTLASNADRLDIAAGQLLNTRGAIQQAGTQGLNVATGRLQGDQGTIATAGTLALTATDISHRQGNLSADRILIDAARLDNNGGQIVATGANANQVRVTGELDNSDGKLASNGDLSLAADRFINIDGLVQQAGDGTLAIEAATLDGRGGTLVSNGSLSIAGETTDLAEGVISAQRIAIATGDLTTAGGQLAATGTDVLDLQVRGTLDNTAGTIGGNGAIALQATTFTNAQGIVQAAGAQRSVFEVAAGLDNRGGTLLTAGDSSVHAGSLSNRGGALQTAGTSQLQVTVDGLLDNQEAGVIASGGDLALAAQSLDNRAGTLGAGGALEGTAVTGIDNTDGLLQAGDSLVLASSGLTNAGGTIVGGDVRIDTRGNLLDNDGGTLASTAGDLDLRTGAVHNIGGLAQSAGDLTLDTGGQTVTNRDSSSAGGLLSAGRMDLHTGDFDNRAGVVFAQDDVQLRAVAIDNTLGGQLGSAANLTVQADRLSNAGGAVQAGGDARLALSGQLDNRGGLVAAANALAVTAASVDNRDTLSASAGAPLGLQADELQVQAGSLDNRQGQVLSDSRTGLQLTGRLDNAAGQVSSGGDLQVRADAVTNTGGTLLSGGDQSLIARQLGGDGRVLSQGDATLVLQDDFTNTGELTANGTLSLTTAGDLRNAGLVQAGNLELQADTIDNTVDGEITAVGTAHLVAGGTLTNRGLIDGAIAHLEAGLVDNVGSGRLYGDHIAIDADELSNRAETLDGTTRSATLAARERLDLGADTLANTGGGLIYSDGNAAIGGALDASLHASGIAERIDNLSSTIEIAGNLDIQSQAINNIRENVVVTQTTTVKDPVRMQRPAWWHNGENATSNIRSTSNYNAYEIYYLDPADILEDEPYVTPDGYTVHRAVVRLTTQTSAYFFGRGALYRARGERSRLDVDSGTVTLYYFDRQDNQVNPDQVANGADDPFAELSQIEPGSPAFSYVSDTLTYSSAYGTCTTHCVQLVAYHDYDDPDHILTNPHGTGGNSTSNNEQYRIATQTVTEDVLAPGVGADAIIHAGGAMRIGTDELVNHYGSIAAGGNLDIVGLTAVARVTNLAQTLYRTYDFDNVSHTFGGSVVAWSNPSISQVIGQIGGSITSGGTLTVDVGELSNLNEGRDAPNVQDSGAIAGLDPHGPGAGPTGPGGTTIAGPGAISGREADTAAAAGPQAAHGGSGEGPDVVQGEGGVAGRTVASAADGSPDTIVAATLDTKLPTASLFTVKPNGGSYLVETDPRFADYRNWLGSDYLLGLLGSDPALTQKRLGDGYYEQRLVNEQIGQLTGRRFLEGYASDEEQFQALMDAGATFAQAYGLRPGVALSAEQMAQLTSDIVWLVEQTVTLPDGSTTTALVPQVYLRLRPGDLNENGALLAGENVELKLGGDLINTGTIAGRQVVSIDATNIQNLKGGAISGRSVGLQATQDINVIGATVTATDLLSVQAGHNVTVASTTQTQEGAGYRATEIDRVAGLYVTDPGGSGVLAVAAGGDVTLQAAQIRNAGTDGLTSLAAAGDLNLSTVTERHDRDSTYDDRNYVRSSDSREVGTSIQGAGSVALLAGNDVNLAAAQVTAGDALAVQAGRDLNSTAATDTTTLDTQATGRKSARGVSASDETVHGTVFQAGGDVALVAGRDIGLQAATVVSEAGGIALSAGRDVSLTTAQEEHALTVDETKKKSGFLKSKTTTTHDAYSDSYALGTVLSGETVQVAAGRDLSATAAQIAGTGDVLLAAGRDVTLDAGENIHSETHDKMVKKSGVFGGGGVGFTIGKQQLETSVDISETIHTGSLIGSLQGDTMIVAGETVNVQGSTVNSLEGNVAISGKAVNIEEVHDTSTYHSVEKMKQGGLTVGASAPVVDAAMDAYRSARTVGQSKDSRVNAMAVANAAYDTYQAAGAAASAMSGQAASVSITVGSQQSKNETSANSSQVVGSSIKAGGRVDILATGAGSDSDIRISGSDVYGGAGTGLFAEDAIDIVAAQSTYEQRSENKSSGWNAGVAISFGSSGWAAGVTAGGNVGKGNSDGETVTQVNSHVGSGGTTTLVSGGTTSIRGGQVSGNRVEVNAADLLIESLQDTETYKSKQMNASAQVTVGYGASVSGSYNQSNIDANYASVTEQSGILAGDGGYAVNVRGKTELVGGIVTSTDAAEAAGRNNFSTGTLAISDIENHAEYKGTGFGVSGGVGTNGKGEQGEHQLAQGSSNGKPGGTSASKSAGFGYDSDQQSSTTRSGINTANLVITDTVGQAGTGKTIEQIKADVATTTSTDQVAANSGALVNRFDAAAVQKEVDLQVQVTQAFDQNRQEAKAELYAHAQAKADEARAIRMANGGVDTEESLRLDEEAAGIKKTAMWLDIAAMGVYAGPDASTLLTGETLTQIDLVRRTATAESKIVVQKCEANGQNCTQREVDLKDVAIGDDGKIYIFNNGIFNKEEYALATGAKQNSNEANEQGVYYILNPYTGNPVAEMLYAGYDKLNDLLGGTLPLTSAEKTNQDIIRIATDQAGVVYSVNHSRGGMTWTNAMQGLKSQGMEGMLIGDVLYNGAAANAQDAANLLQGISDIGRVFQSTHPTDIVGRWVGGNPATGEKNEGGFPDSHSSYTGYEPAQGTIIQVGSDPEKRVDLRKTTDKNWGEGKYSVPVLVPPNKPRSQTQNKENGVND